MTALIQCVNWWNKSIKIRVAVVVIATSLTKIRFDDIALASLAKQGYTADSIPSKGTRVILRNNANLSTGGSATDVTDDVHPEVAARAVAAAQMVGLDILRR